MDSLLGIRSDGVTKLRMDQPDAGWGAKPHTQSYSRSHRVEQDLQVHAPLEVVAAPNPDSHRKQVPGWEQDLLLKQERLLRLLDREQAWYDARQQAALAAERLLSLCEHQQQQWLQSNQQIPLATSAIRV